MRVLPSFPAYTLSEEVETTTPPASGAWAQALAQPAFRGLGLLLVLLLAGLLGALPHFFLYIQQRPGLLLADPLLPLLPRHDVAGVIFVLMYGGSVAALGWLFRHPALLLRGLYAYWLLTGLRMLCIWLLPLAPPLDLLDMPDPFTTFLFHAPPTAAITKDLFFSGHTSTVVLLALAVRGHWWRGALAVVALLIGVLVLVQRVHYSCDVLAAPLFACLAYWVAGFITRPVAEAGKPLAHCADFQTVS